MRLGLRARLAVGFVLVLVLAACSDEGASTPAGGATHHPSHSSDATTPGTSTTDTGPPPTTSTDGPTRPTGRPPVARRPITIAFAGDVHFESYLAGPLDDPETAMGPMARLLAPGGPVDRQPRDGGHDARRAAAQGVHVPGTAERVRRPEGRRASTLRPWPTTTASTTGRSACRTRWPRRESADLPVIGIGEDAAQAFKPVDRDQPRSAGGVPRRDCGDGRSAGRRAGVRPTASRVWRPLSTGTTPPWSAAVKAVRDQVDTVVVDLHYGSDLLTCPTEIQRNLADELVAAGADIDRRASTRTWSSEAATTGRPTSTSVSATSSSTSSNGGPTAETGVLMLTVDGRHVTNPRWVPGQIVNGLPTALTGRGGQRRQRALELASRVRRTHRPVRRHRLTGWVCSSPSHEPRRPS